LFFESGEDRFDFLLCAPVHLEIGPRANLCVPVLKVLSEKKEGEEEKLDKVRDEKPQDECGEGVESQLRRRGSVPDEPARRPDEYDREKPHASYVFRDKKGEPFEFCESLAVLEVGILKRPAERSQLF